MMRFLLSLVFILCLGQAVAAGDSSVQHPKVPIDRFDFSSLQRGAAVFVNYCMGCHSAQYVRYGRLMEDLGIPEDLLRDNLIHTNASLGDGMITAMRADEAAAWLNQAPPDLSLSARLRGADWLYAYMRSFYADPESPSGWNNTVFQNVAMPHVLADLQGEKNGDGVVLKKGRLSSLEYDLLVTDLVNFMDYMADPSRPERYRAGYLILSVLLLLLISSYFLYREYWRDIH